MTGRLLSGFFRFKRLPSACRRSPSATIVRWGEIWPIFPHFGSKVGMSASERADSKMDCSRTAYGTLYDAPAGVFLFAVRTNELQFAVTDPPPSFSPGHLAPGGEENHHGILSLQKVRSRDFRGQFITRQSERSKFRGPKPRGRWHHVCQP